MNLIHSARSTAAPTSAGSSRTAGSAPRAQRPTRRSARARAGTLTGPEASAAYLNRLYYDLAGPRSESALQALLGIADESRLLYGSDWPFTPDPAVAGMLTALRETSVFAQPDELLRANAQRLLPRSRD
jgi:predicted TIM-barrel fold metal-dependent hydrolase